MMQSGQSALREMFEAVLDQPAETRRAYLDLHCADPVMRRQIERLLSADAQGNAALEQGVGGLAGTIIAPGLAPPAVPGGHIGPFELLAILGEGGYSTVFRARRNQAGVMHEVALKVLHRPLYSAEAQRRFQREHRVLAQLHHPGIARLIDGGVSESGQAYIALDLVEGVPITQYARQHQLDLRKRLGLMLQVCRAVEAAQRALIVHRDLKPSNVLVTGEGEVKLLDFGIAKLLDTEEETQTLLAPFTPAYAAPEQIAGGLITTATDVYALGVLLGELITGERLTHASSRTPSAHVSGEPQPGVLPASPSLTRRQLRGDLDNIVVKALAAKPEQRYVSAAALAQDLQRLLDGRPVAAHPPSPWYRTRKFVVRHKGSVLTTAVFLLAILAALAIALWQAQRARAAAAVAEAERVHAQHEADRANATRDFLIDVFRASDPRIAHSRPRGQITAKELLDLNTPKIAQQFAADPQTELTLLGVAAGIYSELEDHERYQALHQQQIALARQLNGEQDPLVLGGLLDDVSAIATTGGNTATALALLDAAAPKLRAAGQEHSTLQARWWLVRGQVLSETDGARAATIEALEHAVALYQELDPGDVRYVAALTFLGGQYIDQEPARAEQLLQRSLAAHEHVRRPDDSLRAGTYMNLASSRVSQGKFDQAEPAYEQADELFRQSRGEAGWAYWEQLANHAKFVHQQGDRQRALAMFEHDLTLIPPDWHSNTSDSYVRELYAACLSAEGRPLLAIPLLEAAQQAYQREQGYEGDLRRAQAHLGDAYARAGRTAQARVSLKTALDGFVAAVPADDASLLGARERWGRFLLAQGELAAAETELREVMTQSHDRAITAAALAQGALARLALLRHDPAAALALSGDAESRFEHLADSRDVRDGPYLWRIHADALRASGDLLAAAAEDARALEASRRYDDPSAPTLAPASRR